MVGLVDGVAPLRGALAQHWLDVIRWAETMVRSNPLSVWVYRDYVIRAFNDDRPYDQFIRDSWPVTDWYG